MQNIPKFDSTTWHLDELKVLWMTILVNLFIKSCTRKSYHNDIKYHMTLTTIFHVVYVYTNNLIG